MNCDEALLAISAALDGELSPAERVKLSEHLLSCGSCRELAEDLRVLTDELGRSDRAVPPELAESVRRAVAEEPQAPAALKKRRAPYLRAVAAMLALCICLGGIGLFASGHMGNDSAGGVAPALYQAAPEDKGYSGSIAPEYGASAGGDSDTAVTEDEPESSRAAAHPTSDGESPAPIPAIAPSDRAEDSDGSHKETREDGGYGPSVYSAPGSENNGEAGDSHEETSPGSAAALTPAEALELVFEHLGGYEMYPEAEQLAVDGPTPAYYLKTVETELVSSDYCLAYWGLYEDGQSHWFRLYEDVSDKREDYPDHEVSLNWYIVSLDGEIAAEFPE